MAHYAKVENGLVTQVLVVPDEHEADGEAYLHGLGLPGRWLQTSYNTQGNEHPNGTPLRYNYAGIGFLYDEERDAFIPPKPDDGDWEFNEMTCTWDSAATVDPISE
jgi:hypothetical protein